jgi:FkbM family methyltransferase
MLKSFVYKVAGASSRLIPESMAKEKMRYAFYKFFYSMPVGFERIKIRNTEFDVIKTLISNHNKEEVIQYTNYYQPKKGDVILDVGAFYGIFSIYASKNVGPSGEVIAFEIDPINLQVLKKNFALNKNKNLVLVAKGLWNKKETKSLSIGGAGSNLFKNNAFTKVTLARGDELIPKLRLKKINLIKMNIEGAEINALLGLKKTIRKYSPKLIIMANHYVNNEMTEKKVVSILKNFGYKLNIAKNKMMFATKK